MPDAFTLVEPGVRPPLDPGFRPAVLANRAFQEEVREQRGRRAPGPRPGASDGALSRFETRVFPEATRAEEPAYVERLVKFLLWQRGGWKVYVGGPRTHRRRTFAKRYSPDGARASSTTTSWARRSTSSPSRSSPASPADVPAGARDGRAAGPPPGRLPHRLRPGRLRPQSRGGGRRRGGLQRRGRLGAARPRPTPVSLPRDHGRPEDRRRARCRAWTPSAAARRASTSTTAPWSPRSSAACRRSASTRSAACSCGIRDELGVPLEVDQRRRRDGAGRLDVARGQRRPRHRPGLERGRRLRDHGRATSPAGSTSWPSAPVDYQPAGAPADEWSGDSGVGAQYFSQQCVFRLAPRPGSSSRRPRARREKLKARAGKLEAGRRAARRRSGRPWASTWATAWPTTPTSTTQARADPGPLHLRRRAASIILDGASEVLRAGVPGPGGEVNIHLPDEKSRRVGQSIAAASLPEPCREMRTTP